MTAPQQPPQRSKLLGWKAIFVLIVLINYAAMIFVFYSSTAATTGDYYSHLPPPPQTSAVTVDDSKRRLDNDDNLHRKNNIINNDKTESPPPILLAGMAFSDNTISDFALSFLIQAACSHNIHSHILLAKRDENTPLDKKIEVLSAHSQPLPLNGKQVRPECRKFIHVEVAPSEEALLNMTKSYHQSNSAMLTEDTPNNPWNAQNRIARIKRSREYQRQLVIRYLTDKNRNRESDWGNFDWTTSQDAVIGVLDLDMFDYPTPVELIDSARDYIIMSNNNNNNDNKNSNEKYHAICSNGLFVMKSRSYNGYRRRYYDTFSTILLPNSWLHVDRDKPRGSLEGEDVEMAKMNQDKTLQWILKEGRRRRALPLLESSGNNNDGGGTEHQFQPVPVRSCFNGLTLYRADVWLEPKCRYDSYHEDDDAYLSKRYQHACEHIVFHECLRRVLLEKEGGDGGEGFNIAVQPDMTTLWHHLS